MAVFTPIQQVALNLPQLSDPIAINGQSFALSAFLQNSLDTNNSNVAQTLAFIFQMLSNFDRLIREQWGEYSYTKRTNMTFAEAYRHWSYVAATNCFSDPTVAPTVSAGGIFAPLPVRPQVR